MRHPGGQAITMKIMPLDWLSVCIEQRKKEGTNGKVYPEDLYLSPTTAELL